MIAHLLKIIWKRKSRNLLLMLEIALAFVLVFAVVAFAARSAQLYRAPLGFASDDVWAIQLQVPDYEALKANPAPLDEIQRSLKQMPQVQEVALVNHSPYSNSTNGAGFSPAPGAHRVASYLVHASDTFAAVLSMPLAEGRWFTAADAGDVMPAVVNRRMAHALFPDIPAGESVVGRTFVYDEDSDPNRKRFRITGVVQDYRDGGEFMTPVNFALLRFNPTPGTDLPLTVMIKLKAGTPRAFEAELIGRLKQLRSQWSYQIAPLADLRTDVLRMVLVPLGVVAVIAAFMLLMVGFGLFGVLWQNTTLRIPEIGLRRAVGARATQIYRQIVAEQLLLCSLAMLLALLLLVQLPLTGLLGEGLNWPVFGIATLCTAAVLWVVSLLSALYPAWQASRLPPAAALHCE